MRWVIALVVVTGCGRFRFDERRAPDAALDACVAGASCTPAAVCWTGVASCGAAGCAVDQPVDQVACPGGTCATGVCAGASTALAYAPAGTSAGFGTAVASDGVRIVVGAVGANRAYVLEQSAGMWSVTTPLSSTWGPASSLFGGAVAIEGDLIAVGARYSKGAGMTPVSGTGGAIVIYQRNTSGGWDEVGHVLGPDGGEFGGAVAISGGRILVGAEYANTIANGYGTAYIVEGTGASWATVATLHDVAADRLGHFVQLAGDRAFVGSLWDPGPVSTETGAVRLWERQPDASWQLRQVLQPDDLRPDAFGQGFSLDGDQLAVGVPWMSDGNRGTGGLFVYTRDASGTWSTPGPIEQAVLQRDANLGRGVWLRGDRMFATWIDWNAMPPSVNVDVYRRQPDGTWLVVGRRGDPSGNTTGYGLGGIEVDLQMAGVGEQALVGHPMHGYLSGALGPGALLFADATGI